MPPPMIIRSALPRAAWLPLVALLFAFAPLALHAQDSCPAHAGAMASLEDMNCLHNGQVLLAALPDGNAVVPTGFTTVYLLTRTNGLIIEQMGPAPNFLVNTVDVWRIHALVFDPGTLDLSGVQFGSTSAYDVQALLLQGGGSICASLDISGAPMKSTECGTPCLAMASTLTMDTTTICLQGGQANLTALPGNPGFVPAGFVVTYLLTRTNGLIIEQTAPMPTFTVGTADVWRIHQLVYDPATLDLGLIQFGTTSAYDLQALLLQGGGAICASLDMSGAAGKTGECEPDCTADAGLVSAEQPDLCLTDGMAQLDAMAAGDAVIPPGYSLVYFLVDGAASPTILDFSDSPSFTVHAAGIYGMHAFVHDPLTFDLALVQPGETTLAELHAQLLQGGGGICASLDLDGAEFQVTACTPACEADAGAMAGEAQFLCLSEGSALLAGTSYGDTLVPPGFVMGYFLSHGPDLVLLGWGPDALFTVQGPGLYHIHAFVHDPTTFDVALINLGTSTIFSLNDTLVQGGGPVCASLDVLGATFTVEDCPPPCGAGLDSTITVCYTDAPFALIDFLGGDPCPNGTWSTPASPVSNGIFNPASDAAGQYTYTVTDPSGAIQSAVLTVNVVECPTEVLTLVPGKDAPEPAFQVTTGVEETARPALRTWPNPATATLHVELPSGWAAPRTMELIDAAGRLAQVPAHARHGNVLALDVSTLRSGNWTLRLRTEGGTFIARFVR